MKQNDFTKGSVKRAIIAQAVPLTVAQLVQLLYNVVDRIYLGHMGNGDNLALTGVGLTFPIVTLISGFAALFRTGAVPLFSIEQGRGNDERAKRILGNSFALIAVSSIALTFVGYLFSEPILVAFGAGEDSLVYAKDYLEVYLIGTFFSMVGGGLAGFINAQGFPKIGMLSVVIGALANIALDPIFIFVLDMGVRGAAIATVISQILSALWILAFLFGRRVQVSLSIDSIRINGKITADISKLGAANFIMSGTTCIVQAVSNRTLQTFGGDLYVGVMTVMNSVREIFTLPVNGIVSGSQPVISYNFGAKRYDRVRQGIKFNTIVGASYTAVAWILILLFPKFWVGIFSDDPATIAKGAEMLTIYFFGFVFMAFQFAGQSTFQALGMSGHAIFFSLLRKVIIVLPLTLILPRVGLGAPGVFVAEPISNFIGGLASFLTMRLGVYRKLGKNTD